MKYLLSLIAVALVLLAGLRLTPYWDAALPAGEAGKIDFATLQLIDKPNQYLVCRVELCAAAEPHRRSPRFAVSVDILRNAVRKLLSQEPNLSVVQESAAGLVLLQRTSLMRWPDWIDIAFIELDDGGSTVAIYSRSVYGRRDFGANRQRVDGWLARLPALLP